MRKNKDGYQIADKKKENKPSMEHFPLDDDANSTLVSLGKEPAFHLEKAVP